MRQSNGVLIVILIVLLVTSVALIVFGANAVQKARQAMDFAMRERERAVHAEIEALEARREAEHHAAIAQATTAFLQDLLRSVDPASGGDVTVAEVLEQAELRADDQLADQPEILERVRETIDRARRELEGEGDPGGGGT